jgi:hypothetical protein
MRLHHCALLVGLALAPTPGLAQDAATATGPKVMLTTSISINLPLTAPDSAARQAEEDKTRQDLYRRSVRECDLLLDSIAATCVITSVSMSSQVNSTPGQADYLYASSTITLDVVLK